MAKFKPQTKKSNNAPPDFNTNWDPKPGQTTTQRFERIQALHNTRQKNILDSMQIPNEIPPTKLTTIYAIKNNEWTTVGYRCLDCGKPMNDPEVLEKHSLICRNDKEINRKEEQDILSRVIKRK